MTLREWYGEEVALGHSPVAGAAPAADVVPQALTLPLPPLIRMAMLMCRATMNDGGFMRVTVGKHHSVSLVHPVMCT